MLASMQTCTGCAACEQVCPRDCLKMEYVNGFQYPVMKNKQDCISCNLCQKACPVLKTEKKEVKFLNAYAARVVDKDEIYKSTSGGFFWAAAKDFIANKGVVYGAGYDENLDVRHMEASNLEQLEILRKSKYVQSEIGDVYRKIKLRLEKNEKVLFSGTPCQVVGLTEFLKKDYKNLIKIQVFCGQITSQQIWKNYIKEIENNLNSKIVQFDFRYKQPMNSSDVFKAGKPVAGWKQTCIYFKLEDNSEYIIPWDKSIFANAYMANLLMRDSCSHCKFKLNDCSYADLSIGDFWGCENNAPECFDPRGVSAVYTHTEKGEEFIRKLEKDNLMHIQHTNFEDIKSGNPYVFISAGKHRNRDALYNEADKTTDAVALIRKHLGNLAAHPEKKLKIGVWGSYNLRMSIVNLCAASNSGLKYQYSNSSIISLMSPKTDIPKNIKMPANPYRAQMMCADWDKTVLSDNEFTNVDYLFVDFLEERFDIAKYKNALVTISDALKDTDFSEYETIERISDKTDELWKNGCTKFAEFLKQNFKKEQIVLVKSYLMESKGDKTTKNSFDSIEKIKLINKKLDSYYNFFAQQFKPCKIIDTSEIPDNCKYCDKNHKHGVLPCHTNKEYCECLTDIIYNTLLEKEALDNGKN